jgi:hypothetical protein
MRLWSTQVITERNGRGGRAGKENSAEREAVEIPPVPTDIASD